MQKGELRRNEFLQVSARLFLQKGYQGTTLQDILDEVGCSKGSFYHHFQSKIQLLEAHSGQRAQESYQAYLADARAQGEAADVAALNRLLYYSCPLRKGEEGFLASVLSLTEPQDWTLLLSHILESMKRAFFPDCRRLLSDMQEKGELSLANPLLPDLLWDTHMVFFITIMLEWVRLVASGGTPASRAVDMLRVSRLQWERLLDLPYGSVEILSAEELEHTMTASLALLTHQQGQLRFDAGFAAPCQHLGKSV